MTGSDVDLWSASLDRRTLLKLGLAAWLLPRELLAESRATWSFAVFSDTHFGIPENFAKNRALLAEIGALGPEVAINIGDVTERGWASEYQDVERGFAGIPFKLHCAPGNHDVRWAPLGLQLFEQKVGAPHQVFEHRGCVFALLDSTVPLSHWGHIGGPQRRWLEQELSRFGSDLPVFVFSHHAPGREPPAVDDDHALGDVLARFNTKVIFTGHGHSDLSWQWRGMACTMGKGLYQGSFQHVQVDADAREIRVYRRTDAGLAATPFLTVPFARQATSASAAAPRPAEATGALRPVWTQPLGGGVLSHLLLDRGTLYVSAMDGSLQALDAKSGKVRWRAMTKGYCFSSPTLAADRVIVGSADAGVYAYDRKSGKQRWHVQTGGPVYASAAFAHGVAAIASGDGRVYGIDAKNGEVRWTWSLPKSDTAFSQSPAATDGERFYIGAWDRFVYALDARTGELVWKYAATPTSFYYSAAIAAPVLADGKLIVPSNDNTLHAIDTRTGEAVWTRKSPGDKYGYSSARVSGDRLYIGCLGDKGEVRCLNVSDGSEVWVAATGATIYESSPAIVGKYIAIGSVVGTLWLIDANTGATAGSFRFPPGHFLSSPATDGRRVYAATLAEQVVAVEVSDA